MKDLIDARERFAALVEKITEPTPIDASLRAELLGAIARIDQKIAVEAVERPGKAP